MLAAVSAVSFAPNPEQAAAEITGAVRNSLADATSVAIFFATAGHGPSYARLEYALRQAIGGPVVGCSAAGVISRAGEREHGPGVAVLALSGDFAAERFFLPALRGRAQDVGHEIGRIAAAVDETPRTVVLLADSYNLAPDELLAGIESAAPGTVVVGAGASEDGSVGEATVVGRGAASNNAVTGLVLGGLHVRSTVVQSAAPVGRWRRVTRAHANRVLELDGRPAVDVFLASLPEILRADPLEAIRRTRAAIADPGSIGDEAPHVIRKLLGADSESGALVIGDEVLVGSRFALAVCDAVEARQRFAHQLDEFARPPHPVGVLYFDSVERGEALYGIADLDSAYLQRVLGDVGMAGFFSGVEIAPLGGRNRFHQASGVLVGFYER
ncbi:FIST C-terminal domain-containing protein [Candidatus Binatia bacterium]|nr:FIST C-terminal domain-containing protein [Candidatus Binatia bacterium]